MTRRRYWFFLIVALGLGALSFVALPPPSSAAEPGHANTPTPGYKLGVNDLIKVEVFGEPTLSAPEAKIDGEGKIALPLLGVLKVHGLTLKEAEELIEQRLADGYLKHPRVTVVIIRYRNYFISGEIKSPGGYPYQEGLTVLKAATLAGGFTDKASTGRIKIKRMKGNDEKTISAALEDIVLPDDIIVVPQSFF